MMSPGTLVTIKPISSIDLRPYRLFSILKSEQDVLVNRFPALVDKIHHGELGLVISIARDSDGHDKARLLTPRGKLGWVKCSHLQEINIVEGG